MIVDCGLLWRVEGGGWRMMIDDDDEHGTC